MMHHVRIFLLAGLALLVVSCAPTLFVGEISDYEAPIAELETRLARNPADDAAMRDLGAIYLRTRHYSQASDYLEQAFARNPSDPKTLFNLALVNEALARRETALRLYEKYADQPPASRYRRLMRGRYEWLSRRLLQEQMEQLAAREPAPSDTVSARIVAVFPLVYQSDEARYAPLGRGLAELVITDLGRVRSLRVVERVRLQALLDELRYSESAYVDPSTAPRVGLLLGAGRLVSGSYAVLPRDNLRLDGALMEVGTSEMLQANSQSGGVRNLFTMEKAFVFDLLNQMQIELTAEERQEIEFIPTQNLQAFLAFSNGLVREDQGLFDEAADYYRQAIQLDPGFGLATQRAEQADAVASADSEIEEFLVASTADDPLPSPGIDLMDVRVGNLNGNIGNGLLPGTDSRNPAAEAGSDAIFLPDPPRPPAGNN